MANSYTANTKLAMPAAGDRTWNVPMNANSQSIDATNAVGDLAVTTTEVPSASLNVAVSSGLYAKQDGTVGTYAGTTSQAIPMSTTKVLYLDGANSWVLTVAASYPATPHVRLASVVAGASTITSITDARVAFSVIGSFADGVDFTLGMIAGTQLGTAANQKLGLWGATPVTQPSGAAQAAVANSTGASPTTTLSACGATNSADQSSVINTNFASLNNLVEAIRSALVASGVMKGSA